MNTWQRWGAIAILLLPFGLRPAQAYAALVVPTSDTLIFSTANPSQSRTFTIPETSEGLVVSQIITFLMPTPAPALPNSQNVALRNPSTGLISDFLALSLDPVQVHDIQGQLIRTDLAIGINFSSDTPESALGTPPLGTIILDESVTPSTGSFGGLDVSISSDVDPAPPAGVPEPGTLALMMSGVVGLVCRHRSQRRAP